MYFDGNDENDEDEKNGDDEDEKNGDDEDEDEEILFTQPCFPI